MQIGAGTDAEGVFAALDRGRGQESTASLVSGTLIQNIVGSIAAQRRSKRIKARVARLGIVRTTSRPGAKRTAYLRMIRRHVPSARPAKISSNEAGSGTAAREGEVPAELPPPPPAPKFAFQSA